MRLVLIPIRTFSPIIEPNLESSEQTFSFLYRKICSVHQVEDFQFWFLPERNIVLKNTVSNKVLMRPTRVPQDTSGDFCRVQ